MLPNYLVKKQQTDKMKNIVSQFFLLAGNLAKEDDQSNHHTERHKNATIPEPRTIILLILSALWLVIVVFGLMLPAPASCLR